MQRLHTASYAALFILATLTACEPAAGDNDPVTIEPRPAVPERQIGATATAEFIDRDGRTVGEATLEEGPAGVLIRGEISGLSPGAHGFHVHAVGRCEPPFETAGAHFAPHGRQHGLLNEQGPHAGDMPNIVATADGRATFEVHSALVTIGTGPGGLLDADGTSIVVHANADDHRTDPSGASGDRIACAVVR
jgi:superoxide dismutase, Cu-Zn family